MKFDNHGNIACTEVVREEGKPISQEKRKEDGVGVRLGRKTVNSAKASMGVQGGKQKKVPMHAGESRTRGVQTQAHQELRHGEKGGKKKIGSPISKNHRDKKQRSR